MEIHQLLVLVILLQKFQIIELIYKLKAILFGGAIGEAGKFVITN
jgi:hypothetical protein